MFSIFDASSFTNINRKPAPLETPKNAPNTFTSSARTKATTSDATSSIQGTKLSGFQQRQIKTHNIVGTRFRSKTGCLNCRRRKYVNNTTNALRGLRVLTEINLSLGKSVMKHHLYVKHAKYEIKNVYGPTCRKGVTLSEY